VKIRLLVALVPAVALLGLAVPALASDPQEVSTNWAGYEATPYRASGFSAVSAGWTQPAAQCGATGQGQYAAFWVGLGGGQDSSQALEQVGTQANCSGDGSATYYAWYELVPAGPVRLGLSISAGDRIYARTAVRGDSVLIQLRDETTGQSVSRTLQMTDPAPDTSTAEWVAEAPSSCSDGNTTGCSPLPLADFGTVKFTNAYATSNGATGAIDGSNWNTAAINLSSGSSAGASPSSVSAGGAGFTVSYGGGDGGGGYSGYGGGGGYGGGYGYYGGGYYGGGGGYYGDGGGYYGGGYGYGSYYGY